MPEYLCNDGKNEDSFDLDLSWLNEKADIFIFAVDSKGLLRKCNRKAEDITGYSEEQVLGRSFIDKFVLEDYRNQAREMVNKALQGQETFSNPLPLHSVTGGNVWILFTITTLYDMNGNIIGVAGFGQDISEHKKIEKRLGRLIFCRHQLNKLHERLFSSKTLQNKLGMITDSVVSTFDADFCRIWITMPGDRCTSGCIHAKVLEGPHVCRYREKCLHLMASSGRYTHIDGEVHRRVPFGCYKIGRVAAGQDDRFLTNDAQNDTRIHNPDWARELGLVSFAGYRLLSGDSSPIGVLALFAKHAITPDEDILLAEVANLTAQVIQMMWLEEIQRENLEKLVKNRTEELAGANEKLRLEIAERKNVEKILRESEGKLKAMLQSIGDLVMMMDRDFNIIWATEFTMKIFGDDIIGKKCYEVFHNRKEPCEPYPCRTLRTFQDGKVYKEEICVTDKDGKTLYFYCTTSVALRDEAGNPVGVMEVLRDITERRQAEEAVKKYAEHLEEMVEERTRELKMIQEKLIRQEKLAILGQLAGGVGHELRNPLGVISNAVYFLKTILSASDGMIREYLDIISQQVDRSVKIVSDLMDFSCVKSLEKEAIEVSGLVTSVLELLPPPEQVKVIINIPFDVPPIFADIGKTNQILMNLVSNAYQAMPKEGELYITAGVNNEGLYISIKDTGCGISEENMEKIFEPLFTTRARGIGLGLAVAKNLAEVNGGYICAESIEGIGSTFTVTFPVVEVMNNE